MTRLFSRIPPIVRFAAVGVSGTLPNLLIVWLCSEVWAENYVLGLVLGAQAGVAWNFILTDRLVFPGRRDRNFWGRLWRFALVGNLDLVARLPLTVLLVEWWGLPPVPAAALVIAGIFLAKWLLVSRVVWRPGGRGNDVSRV
jgi:dolichol-phosphate mannosyltransferase